jgi:hypothetical protein
MMSVGRVVVGSTLLVAPRRAGGRWLGPIAQDRAVTAIIRATAGRDLAIGAGTLQALAAGDAVRGWTLAGAASDLVDAAATAVAIRRIGVRRAVPVVAVALVAGLAGLSAADRLD